MGTGLLTVKIGFILFMKDYQFSLHINTLERERERAQEKTLKECRCDERLKPKAETSTGFATQISDSQRF
jgi:hypothetical protein